MIDKKMELINMRNHENNAVAIWDTGFLNFLLRIVWKLKEAHIKFDVHTLQFQA